ncbi:GNAT family N-acetyltransferase [Clostridiaceae bacterium M8S5]|nr:GNAT family N-acetyltransferase [Clostridiaceae bacterium M8S5]
MDVAIIEMSDKDYVKASKILNLEDVDPETLIDLNLKMDNIYSIVNDNKLVGIAQISEGKFTFIYVFIDPTFRHKGIGFEAIKLCEQKICNGQSKQIMTTYRVNDVDAEYLANKFGYKRKYSSTYMKYTGNRFDIENLPIRGYRDEDYESAHEMYAKAFHEMRVEVGDFPNSVIEQPNDKMRKNWAETLNERLVYIQDGEIVGFAHIKGNEIGSVSVKSEYQGKGIGRAFIKYICNRIFDEGYDSIILYCVVGNKAKKLYDSLGFKDIYIADYATKLR